LKTEYRKAVESDKTAIAKTIAYSFEHDFSGMHNPQYDAFILDVTDINISARKCGAIAQKYI
jgi:hypothetical protein